MDLTTVAVSLAAAVAFGWSAAAMHRGASSTPEESSQVVGLVLHLVRSKLWFSGLVASLVGLGLHAVALHRGAISVVQPLVVQSLIFSLVFRAAFEHALLPWAVLRWAGVSTIGLALLLVCTRSTGGTSRPDGARALVALGLGLAAGLACWQLSRVGRPLARGPLLGAAVGIAFGLTAGALKATVGEPGLVAVLQHPAVYVLVVLGVGGQSLNQLVYRRTALRASLPALNAVNPVVALLVGVTVFDEHPYGTGLDVVGAVTGLLLVVLGLALLARFEAPAPAGH